MTITKQQTKGYKRGYTIKCNHIIDPHYYINIPLTKVINKILRRVK